MRPALALLLVAACARDLELPEPPVEAPEELGELSGFYSLTFVETIAGVPVERLHASHLAVMHLGKSGEEPDPVAGFIFDDIVDLGAGLPTDAELEPALLFSRAFLARFDGQRLAGESERVLSVLGERVPGGGAMRLALDDPGICPRPLTGPRTPRDVRARRVCTFDAATSGVYRGTAAACEGGSERTTYLGVGFFEDLAIALRFPEEQEVAIARYDTFTAAGLGLVLAEGGFRATTFQLEDDRSTLRLEMEVFDETGCLEHRSMTRLAGGTPTPECSVTSVLGTELDFQARTIEEGERRFLDLRVFPTASPTMTVPPATPGLRIRVETGGDVTPAPVPADEVPEGQTARFAIRRPEARAGAEAVRYYEVDVSRLSAEGFAGAPLRCLRDRVPAR